MRESYRRRWSDLACGRGSCRSLSERHRQRRRSRQRRRLWRWRRREGARTARGCYFNKLVLCFVFFLHIIDWSLHQKLDAFIFIIIFLINHLDVFIRLYLNTSFLSVMIADFNY